MAGPRGGQGAGGSLLTLKNLPHSVIEGFFALALVLALAVPLIARIQRLLTRSQVVQEEPKTTGRASVNSNHATQLNENCSKVPTGQSTPCSSSSGSHVCLGFPEKSSANVDGERKMFDLVYDGETDFMESPVIDDSTREYLAFRHRLLDKVLKKQYDDHQPPGLVIMNSLHLNSPDNAKVAVEELDFLGFAEDIFNPQEVRKRRQAKLIHPLDHFLAKGPFQVTTEEKAIETKSPSLWSIIDAPSEMMSSVKIETEFLPDSPSLLRCDERPKTAGSKLPCAVKTPRSHSQSKSKIKVVKSQSPEVLRIERKDSFPRSNSPRCKSGRTRLNKGMLVADSSSDVDSSTCEPSAEQRRRLESPVKDAKVKTPWMTSGRVTSLNRKFGNYGKLDAFQERWSSRSRSRRSSPRRTPEAVHDSTSSLNSAGHVRSMTPSPSPPSPRMRSLATANSLNKDSEVLKVTMLSTSMESQMHDKRHTLPTRKRREAGPSESQRTFTESTAPPKYRHPPSSAPGHAGTPQRRTSKLPLHVNSKKPIGKSGKDTDSEDKRISLSSYGSSATLVKMQRPKTSTAVFARRSSRSEEIKHHPKEPTDSQKATTRPKTSDVAAGKLPKSEGDHRPNRKPPTAGKPTPSAKTKRKLKEDTATNKEEEVEEAQPSTPVEERALVPRRPEPSPRLKLAMNRGLKTCIEKMKLLLAEQRTGQLVRHAEIVNLSLAEIVLANLDGNIEPADKIKLKDLLLSAEKNMVIKAPTT